MSKPKTKPKNKASKPHAAALQIVPDSSQDAEMGRQLTEQYQRAVGGMKEVVIFGAMMMRLRELHPEVAQRGGDRRSKSTADFDQPLTLQKWLETHAPQVKRTTALRFLAVTESIAQEYPQIVGTKMANKMSLAELVTKPASELPDSAAKKQLELFDFISGTSQRSWLDRFLPAKSGGGNHRTSPVVQPAPLTPEQLAQQAKDEITSLLNALDAWFTAAHHTRLDPTTRKTADAVLEAAVTKIRTVKD